MPTMLSHGGGGRRHVDSAGSWNGLGVRASLGQRHCGLGGMPRGGSGQGPHVSKGVCLVGVVGAPPWGGLAHGESAASGPYLLRRHDADSSACMMDPDPGPASMGPSACMMDPDPGPVWAQLEEHPARPVQEAESGIAVLAGSRSGFGLVSGWPASLVVVPHAA